MDQIFSEHGEELSGNDIKKLKYIDQVVQEMARLAQVFVPARICTKDWKITKFRFILKYQLLDVTFRKSYHYKSTCKK